MFSFLPENERYELSRSSTDEVTAVSRTFDVRELTSKLAVRYGYESLLSDPAIRDQLEVTDISSADEVVRQLVRFGLWQESLLIRTAQQQYQLDREASELQKSVEGLLLLFTGLANQNMMGEVNCLTKLHSAASFVDEVFPPSSLPDTQRDFVNNWILHQIACFLDREGSRAAFLAFWKYFSATSIDEKMFKKLTASYVSSCLSSHPNPFAATNPLPFLLSYGRTKEAASMVSEIFSSPTGKPTSGMSEYWLNQLQDELKSYPR